MGSNKWKVLGIILMIGIVIVSWGLIDYLPQIGDVNSAPNRHISRVYIEEGPTETNSPNMVTGVLADYRGFDTLLETTVMFLAGVAVAMILSNKMKRRWDKSIFGNGKIFGGPDVKVIMPIVIPVILIYAAYVLFHGEVSLGGGFQAGALSALAYILYTLVANLEIKGVKVTQHFSICVAAVGVLIYAGTGILPMLNGGKYLEYGKLPFKISHVAELHSIGIVLIEIGVTVCVMATIITILQAVLERNSLNDRN